MNCKDEDICSSCFLRRKRYDCGQDPFSCGPDMEGEYTIDCIGYVGRTTITTSRMNDCLEDYHGIGDPIPYDLMFPILIWSGFNWLNNSVPGEWVLYKEKGE